MSGIAGIARPDMRAQVETMLTKLVHRGPEKLQVIEAPGATLGVVTRDQDTVNLLAGQYLAQDAHGGTHCAQAQGVEHGVQLKRDPLGVVPLYYGSLPDGEIAFASEVKALLPVTNEVEELPPGHTLDDDGLRPYFQLGRQPEFELSLEEYQQGLRSRLETAVEKRVGDGEFGAWLSGGLDSSSLAALARPYTPTLHTFAAGVEGSDDLGYAREVADYLDTNHNEVVVTLADMLSALPEVIYHLESFDAWLVRSSITNYLVAKRASDFVPAVFSGEGGDELFAGYDYLKDLPSVSLADELVDITGRLHNTALQRVDRCASAHGTVAYVSFLDASVVDWAFHIPAEYKLHDGVEKWILRKAVADLLPESVTFRPKAKFWQGAGVEEQIADHVEGQISDTEFEHERQLANGLQLNSKEELYYYRVFREHFGDLEDLNWMGRTKGTPVS
jgi:asparagine synthase (glutamine-hydrolysing)